MNNNYRPNLPSDTNYLQGISDMIKPTKDREDIRFEYLTDLTNYLGLPNPYDFVSTGNFNPAEMKSLEEELYSAIITRNNDEELIKILYRLWDYLCESDDCPHADLIFLFWWPAWSERATEAIRLYHTWRANKLLFTGQKSSFMTDVDVTEAEFYRRIALESWVPEADIIMEIEAINTPENVVNSVKILERLGFFPKKVIWITLNYHMKRAALTFKAAYPWDAGFFRFPIDTKEFHRDEYFLDRWLFSYVFYEYVKLYWARLMWHF